MLAPPEINSLKKVARLLKASPGVGTAAKALKEKITNKKTKNNL